MLLNKSHFVMFNLNFKIVLLSFWDIKLKRFTKWQIFLLYIFEIKYKYKNKIEIK